MQKFTLSDYGFFVLFFLLQNFVKSADNVLHAPTEVWRYQTVRLPPPPPSLSLSLSGIPLPTAKDLSDPNNVRPIFHLSILTKPLHKYLTQYIEDQNLFHPFQSGIRQRHSCHTALIRICDSWLAAVNQAQLTGAVFLDLSKAFALVDHTILLQKLAIYLQNPSTISLLKSFLQDRMQSVFLLGTILQKE